ncbi:hypothetical protein AALP_AA7G140900 [Arabis alpina]|uniref:Uncharacterized protein n=1 Tax=Arabis alpina TaxID=50452 RepID=A0A087GHY7_ARAAL|nr:hypothetical protein AALP_AA7G140900 [Arabis alpina]
MTSGLTLVTHMLQLHKRDYSQPPTTPKFPTFLNPNVFKEELMVYKRIGLYGVQTWCTCLVYMPACTL